MLTCRAILPAERFSRWNLRGATAMLTMNPENLGIFAYARFPASNHNATNARWFRSIRNLPQFLQSNLWIA
jgi:hypothetical protein